MTEELRRACEVCREDHEQRGLSLDGKGYAGLAIRRGGQGRAREDAAMKTPPIVFILPPQPKPGDKRPRNAFGYLKGFGEASKRYYAARKAKGGAA